MRFPKKKWLETKSAPGLKVSESQIQSFADEYLELKKYLSFRFPDGFLAWIKMNAPAHIARIFFDKWAGRPDNTFFVPLNNGYHLAVPMELKSSTGKLHGKQKTNAKNEGWHIARSPEQVMSIVASAEAMAEKIKKMM